jgi:hypothetical protein
MRVAFHATRDDLVDVNLRALARSRMARGWRWQGCLATGLLTGLIFSLLIPEPPEFSKHRLPPLRAIKELASQAPCRALPSARRLAALLIRLEGVSQFGRTRIAGQPS